MYHACCIPFTVCVLLLYFRLCVLVLRICASLLYFLRYCFAVIRRWRLR